MAASGWNAPADAWSEAAATGLREALAAAGDLLACASTDDLCRRAVELARERLGVERCAIFALEEGEPGGFRGTYGTDHRGTTTAERDQWFPVSDSWQRRLERFSREETAVDVVQAPWREWRDGAAVATGEGWVAITPIRCEPAPAPPWGVFCNDSAISKEPLHPFRQEAVGVYCSLLGSLIARKQAQADLREMNQFRGEVLDNVGVGIVVYDRDLRYAVWNRFMEEYTGRSAAEVLGQRAVDTFPHLQEQGVGQMLSRALAGETVSPAQPLRYERDGETLYYSATYRPHRAAGGEIEGVIGVITDVTHRVRTQQSLGERANAERRFREQLVALNELGSRLARESTVDGLCERAVTLGREALGFERLGIWFRERETGNALGSFGTDIRGETRDERGTVLPVAPHWPLARVFERRVRVLTIPDFVFEAEDGSVLGRGTSLIAALWNGEEVVGALCADNVRTGTALTEQHAELLALYAATLGHLVTRKRAEEALRQRESTYRLLFENAGEALLMHDMLGMILDANPAACSLLGYTREEMRQRSMREIIAPQMRERAADGMERLLRDGNVQDEAVVVHRSGHEILLEVNCSLVDLPQGRAVLCIGRDVTERRRVEEERRRFEARTQHAQRLESLGVLAGGVAHDFSNLLMGILGNTGLALIKLPPDSDVRRLLDRIETTCLRASELTNQMLAYAGKARFVIQVVDPAALVREMAQLLASVLPKSLELRTEFDPDAPAVEGDPAQIRQVVMNLITNAGEAMGNVPGAVIVRVQSVCVDDRVLAAPNLVGDLVAGAHVLLEVTDAGCGMDAETQARMFDPFFTTKFLGRGLGMAAVLGIVRGHGGAIQVDSRPGQGTTIRVYFPAATGVALSPPAAHLIGGDAPVSGTVLVVDDDAGVRQVAEEALSAAGFTVLTAADGLEALVRFEQNAAGIALVVLDLSMPRMGGEDACDALRRIRPDVSILLSSGYGEEEVTQRMGGREVAGFIRKPYRPMTLVQQARALITGQRHPVGAD